MKKRYLLAALIYALPTAAFAQCSGIQPAGSVCGNPSGAGTIAAPTRTPVLGLPGSVLGSLGFANTTSGTITLQAQTGALGSSVLTLPATTGTLATTAGASIPAGVQGDTLFYSGTNVLTTLTKSTSASRYLSNTGTTNNPAWAQVDLTNGVTGALPPPNGGTGITSYAIGDMLYASGATTLSKLAAGTSGYALMASGAGIASTYQGFLQAGTGAVTRTWPAKVGVQITPQDFGAGSAGFTSAAIQKALDYANTLNGATVDVTTCGTYTLTSTMTLYPKTRLIGGGLGCTIFQRSGDYGDTLKVGSLAAGGAQGVEIKGVWFVNPAAQAWTGTPVHANVYSGQSVIIEGNWFWGLDGGVLIDGGTAIDVRFNEFAAGGGQVGTYAAKQVYNVALPSLPTSNHYHHNYFSPSGYTYGLILESGEVTTVTNNYFGGYTTAGIWFNTKTINSGVSISNNFIDPGIGPGTGILFSYGDQYAIEVSIANNHFYGLSGPNNHIADVLDGSSHTTVSDLTITGNTLRDSLKASMRLSAVVGGVISNNTILNYNYAHTSTSDPEYAAGIYVLSGGGLGVSRNLKISANNFGSNGSTIWTTSGDANNYAVWGVYTAGGDAGLAATGISVSDNTGVLRTGGSLVAGDIASQSFSTVGNATTAGGLWNFTSTPTSLSTTAGASAGPFYSTYRNSTAAANNLIGAYQYYGNNSTPTFFEYARTQAKIKDHTAASEDSELSIQTAVAGTLADRVTIGQGVQIGSPTGTDKGAGTLNAATGIYINNVAVPTTAGASIPTLATGDILYASAANTLSALADIATGNALITGGVGVAPSYGKIGISTHVSGLGTGVATALGVNVGSAGAVVVNGGALGTPSSGTLSSATGLPISTGVSGLGTGVATALAVNIGTAGSFVVNGGALGSPSSAGTIPAFTLGGTVSGGGNQINNVVIGTSTPLAGSFTTVVGTSFNGNTITTGTGTLTFTSGAVLTASTTTSVGRGQYLATNTNDNATAGNIGEFTEASASAVSLSTGGETTVTSISLGAGDWDIDLLGGPVVATSTNVVRTSLCYSLTTNTCDFTLGKFVTLQYGAAGIVPGNGQSLFNTIPNRRASLSGTTTVYCVLRTDFSVSTATGSCQIQARRVR